MQYKKLWIAFGLIMVVSFSVLGGVGYKAINSGPPIPAKVVTEDGRLLFTGETIRNGQNVWQSTGGQEIGTIWGHGAYVAPDWSADYLHRQSEIVLESLGEPDRVFPIITPCRPNRERRIAGPVDRTDAAKYV